jgi:hypothetical protein
MMRLLEFLGVAAAFVAFGLAVAGLLRNLPSPARELGADETTLIVAGGLAVVWLVRQRI